jgi:DNA-directed RNA polymerase subunit RPC12/RpoP
LTVGRARNDAIEWAERAGKVVHSIRDRQLPEKYLWVQFSDAEIRIGEPCPACGSRRLLRLHTKFARCPECNVQLMLSSDPLDDEDGDEAPDGKDVARLRNLTSVQLTWFEQSDDGLEVYRGYGEEEGKPCLVIAKFRVEPDEELSPENAFARVEKVTRFPLQSLAGLVDDSLIRGQDGPGKHLIL